jgi:hypothetical protein
VTPTVTSVTLTELTIVTRMDVNQASTSTLAPRRVTVSVTVLITYIFATPNILLQR